MISYWDTSALVPLLVREPSTSACQRVWIDSDDRASSRLAFVEVAAALAQAERLGRVSTVQHGLAMSTFSAIWGDIDIIEPTQGLVAQAALLARSMALRGYDAVHCASALALADPDLVAVSGDTQLLAAWTQLGLSVADVNRP